MKLRSCNRRLFDLPDACIVTALLFLDVKDALRFRRACRHLNLVLERSQNEYWRPCLCRDFDLQLQVMRTF